MKPSSRWNGVARRDVVLAGFLVIFPLSARAATWKDPTPEEKAIVEDEAHSRSGAIYLEKIYESRLGDFSVYVRAKILSRKGFSAGTVDDISENAVDIAGRTFGPSGLITDLDKSEIRTMTTLKAAGSTKKRLGFTMPALEPGCFIEYTFREPGHFGSHGEYHADIAFQDRFPILHQEIRTPSQFQYSSSIRYAHGVKIRMEKPPGHVNYIADNIPAVKDEPYGLPEEERRAGVIFSFFFEDIRGTTADAYWKNVFRLAFVPFIMKQLARPSKFEDVLKSVPGSRTADPAARLAALYRYVQKNFKDRDALPAGERPPTGGWKKNSDAADTLAHGSGDTEDLSALFLSLLRADGYKYRVIFVPDRQRRLFHMETPSAFQFDTWIVEVRDPGLPQPVCLSFEHPSLAYGQIPWNHLDVDSLAVDLDSAAGVKVRMPSGPAVQNLSSQISTETISPEGDVRIETESRWTGLKGFDERARVFREGAGEVEKTTREQMRKLDPPEKLESLAYDHVDDPNVALIAHSRATRKMSIMPTAKDSVLLSPLRGSSETNPFSANERTEPIRFPYAYVTSDTVILKPPSSCRFLAVPEPVERRTSVGHYSAKATANPDGSVTVERIFELTVAAAGEDAYDAYQRLFENSAREDESFTITLEQVREAPAKAKP